MSDSADPRRKEPETAERARDVMGELDRKTDREILEVLDANSPLHVMDIARTAGQHPITVDLTCARLHERGYIRSVGRGVYDVTSDGAREIGGGPDPDP